jgi:phytanoyl-CoA dioxygenase PhyH
MPDSSQPMATAPLSATLLPGVPLVESPLFAQSIDAMGLTEQERGIAMQLHGRGYAVLDFPDSELDARIERIKGNLGPRYEIDLSGTTDIGARNLRLQDAWEFDDDVRAIAANPAILALLGKLYGRRAFPFQTLNFPVGTEQHPHADAAHFSSQPERFMCGVWLAMEDIRPEAGPLIYYPGSHAWPIVSNAMIGRAGWGAPRESAQAPFEAVWRAMLAAHDIAEERFLPRKGQALIWAANLLHGGAPRSHPRTTRWSQVTHYYFADCIYYTPAFSDEPLGRLDLRAITNIATGAIEPNSLLGEEIINQRAAKPRTLRARLRKWFGR